MGADPAATGTRIRKRRQVLRMTQEDLAAALGVSKSTVANWERGKHFPLRYLGAVEATLGVSLDTPSPRDELVPADEWERLVLADETLPYGERADIVRRSRAARARLYPALEPPSAPPGDGRRPAPASAPESAPG